MMIPVTALPRPLIAILPYLQTNVDVLVPWMHVLARKHVLGELQLRAIRFTPARRWWHDPGCGAQEDWHGKGPHAIIENESPELGGESSCEADGLAQASR